MRLGDLIDALERLAEHVPGGWDAELIGGACDGTGLATTGIIEVTTFTRVAPDGTQVGAAGLVRVHAHGENVAYLPGVAENADREPPEPVDP